MVLLHNFSAEPIEGNQILLLVEPPEKPVEREKKKKSTWSIINQEQKDAYQRVLNRSKLGRSKILKKLRL